MTTSKSSGRGYVGVEMLVVIALATSLRDLPLRSLSSAHVTMQTLWELLRRGKFRLGTQTLKTSGMLAGVLRFRGLSGSGGSPIGDVELAMLRALGGVDD